MSIGGQEIRGKLVTVQMDMPGDIDGILDAVRRIMMMGEIRSIVMRDGEPLTYQRYVRPGEEIKPSESTASFAELTLMDVVRQIQMEEYAGEHGGANVSSYFLKMVFMMEFDGWVFTHLLVSEKTKFWTWQGVPEMVAKRLPHFLGARIEREKTLPDDIFILCGSKTRGASISEVSFALKGNIQ